MGLETGVTYIEDLVSTNPDGATDDVAEGDDHVRNIKTAVQGSLPNLGAEAVTKTAAEINNLLDKSGDTITGDLLYSSTTFQLAADDVDNRIIIEGGTSASAAVGAYVSIEGIDFGGSGLGGQIELVPATGKTILATNNIEMSTAPTAASHLTRMDFVEDGVSTLTNKTLTSPTINTPTFSAGAIDTADIANSAVDTTQIAADAVRFASEIDGTITTGTITGITSSAPQFVPAGVVNLGSVSAGANAKLQIHDGVTWIDVTALITAPNDLAQQVVSDGINARLLGGSGTATTVTYRRIFA